MPANFGSGSLDAPWLSSGPLPRLLDVLDGDGEEARVVGGAVRNALLEIPVARYRHRDHRVARRSDRAAPGPPASRRCRPASSTAPSRVVVEQHPFEVTTLARGRRDLRPPRQGRVRPRLGGATRSGAISPSTRCRSTRDGTVHDYVGGLDDLAARRVRFIGDAGPAHRRRLSAHPAVLPLPCRLRRRRAGPRAACPPASRARAGLATLSRERVRMEMLKLMVADGAAGAVAGDGGWRAAAADFRRRRLYRTVHRDDRGGAPAWT